MESLGSLGKKKSRPGHDLFPKAAEATAAAAAVAKGLVQHASISELFHMTFHTRLL